MIQGARGFIDYRPNFGALSAHDHIFPVHRQLKVRWNVATPDVVILVLSTVLVDFSLFISSWSVRIYAEGTDMRITPAPS